MPGVGGTVSAVKAVHAQVCRRAQLVPEALWHICVHAPYRQVGHKCHSRLGEKCKRTKNMYIQGRGEEAGLNNES